MRVVHAHTRTPQNPTGGARAACTQVETYDGRLTAVAQCLVAGPLSRLPQEVVPPETHMQALRCGAAEIGLSPMWQVGRARAGVRTCLPACFGPVGWR